MRYVGRTEQSLSGRWAGHRSARKLEGRKKEPLYLAMNECGLQLFAMEELEECEKSIMKERELDYMRKFDSWNPLRGYNKPINEAIYARRLYFLYNPDRESKYDTLRNELRKLDTGSWEWKDGEGFRELIPCDPALKEELGRLCTSSATPA